MRNIPFFPVKLGYPGLQPGPGLVRPAPRLGQRLLRLHLRLVRTSQYRSEVIGVQHLLQLVCQLQGGLGVLLLQFALLLKLGLNTNI